MSTRELQVQLSRRTDGNVILRCTRRDGSFTWQRYDKHALFYSMHDLLHFAVETTLEFDSGFYNLIAEGWDITETTGLGPRGKPPAAAGLVEHIVNLLQAGGASPLSAVEFNAQLDEILGIDAQRPRFTDAQLALVRSRFQDLLDQWAGVPPGSALDLTFIRA